MKMENGMRRAMRYFLRMAELSVLYTAALSVGMAVYMWLIGNHDLRDAVASFPNMLLLIAVLMLYISRMTAGQQIYGPLISMGCRRRNIFWGMLLMEFVYAVQCVLLYRILHRLLNPADRPVGLLAVLAFFLLIDGVSGLSGIAMMKWGRIAHIVFVVMIGVISAAAGMCAVMFAGSVIADTWIGIVTESVNFRQCMMALAGAGIFVASGFLSWRFLRNYEIRT